MARRTFFRCPRYTDIFVRLRVVNGDGSLLIKGQKVYPSPAFACTLFQQLGVFYNETRIGQSSNMLPYVSYLKCLANCTSDVVATYLSRAMLFMTDICEFVRISNFPPITQLFFPVKTGDPEQCLAEMVYYLHTKRGIVRRIRTLQVRLSQCYGVKKNT